MFARISGPLFEAQIDFSTGQIAEPFEFMRGWSLFKIVQYCADHGWDCSVIDPKGIFGTPDVDNG